MYNFNDDKIKKALESVEVPEQISPENIKKMLDEKAPVKKRSKITHKALRVTAGAAACAVICGFGVHYAEQGDLFNRRETVSEDSKADIAESSQTAIGYVEITPEGTEKNAFMKSASEYGELYFMLEKASADINYGYVTDNAGDVPQGIFGVEEEIADAEMNESYTSSSDGAVNNFTDNVTNTTGRGEETIEHSETYNQEEGVLEADIFKTDGEYIYYIHSSYVESEEADKLLINVAEADNGIFANSLMYDITDDFAVNEGEHVSLRDMYLYNDMLIVIGDVQEYYYYYGCYDTVGGGSTDSKTFVNIYTTGEELQHIGSYMQDGSYNDVRITSDGYMYLITDDSSEYFDNIDGIDDIISYIPSYEVNGESRYVPAENILLPDEEFEECSAISYTIIGSLDFNSAGSFAETDIKAIAGFSGSIYCSGANLYTAKGWDNTEITRIALESGTITPAASGTVKGYIKDQFSMSEYEGYFRIATTCETWTESEWFDEDESSGVVSYGRTGIDNYVYVLDMDLNEVGRSESYGHDETIKSVSFSGNLAYVVTYEQTDPLFSIDLSNPVEPVILDEFKILGYSTYMQQWSDGLLLGFGANADENGIEDGVKLVMFDNSDPNNLQEVGIYVMSGNNESWVYSGALWERKALLIAPEKNLIGVPLNVDGYQGNEYVFDSKYMFFSYQNGEFSPIGEISSGERDYYGMDMIFDRACYIGDHVYALSGEKFVSADIATITTADTAYFDYADAVTPGEFVEIPEEPAEPVKPVEPTEPTEPVEPLAESKIVFVQRNVYWTEQYIDKGRYIDINGNVYTFDFCDTELSDDEFVAKLYEHYGMSEPVSTVDGDAVYACWEKIDEIDLASEIIETHQAYDAGQDTIYVIDENLSLIELYSEGDYLRERNDAAAKELAELYDNLWN